MESIKYFSRTELKRLFKYTKRHCFIYYGAYYLATLFGLRVSEVCNLRQGDLSDGKITIHRLKGSQSSTFIVSPEVIDIFAALDTGKKNARLFHIHRSTFDRVLKDHCRRLKISKDKAHFHTFKHTCAMQLLDSGVNIRTIQLILGHKNINNTLQYLRISGRQVESEMTSFESYLNADI